MNRFTHFIFYNNTIPIVLGVLFLGAGATFAASPEARDSVIDSKTVVTAVDNSYLLDTTITDGTVGITIGSVTENSEEYFIEYQISTMEPRDGAWQPTTRIKTLVVNKESVVGRDLGLYAEEEISEVHASEVRLLKEAQEIERRAGITPKVITTEYSGLVGQFFDPNQEVFPQYEPQIDPGVGTPLTREQEKAHEAVRRLIEEAKENEQQGQNQDEQQEEPPEEPGGGGGETTPEEEPPIEEQPVDPDPTPEPPPPESAPEPTPESTPEPPPTLESIGL
jgi:hypothetical protein